MSDASSPHQFDLHILKQLEKLFGEDDLKVLVYRSDAPDVTGKPNSAVRVIHLPTGTEATSFEFDTQIRNKAACLMTLLLDTPRSR